MTILKFAMSVILNHILLEIYSLSNKLVHSSKDLAFSWDGSVSGRPAPEGRYSWVMSYKREDGNRVRLEGEVVLVR